MNEGDLFTQIRVYLLEMNSLSNTETTLSKEQRLGQNKTLNNRHSENQECTKSYTKNLKFWSNDKCVYFNA
jgi:hypothetical protein